MRILVVTGKSGGHIFPALALLEKLQENADVTGLLLVLPRESVAREFAHRGFSICFLSIRSIRLRAPGVFLRDTWMFLKGCFESLIILCRFRPHTVVSFGSLTGIPLVLFSRAMGVKKIILHEQNMIPGRAQRFAAFFSHWIAISFAETRECFGAASRKTVLTGNPLRGNITKIERSAALRHFSLKEDVCTLLVMGGSQGSGSINKAFLSAARSLSDRHRFQVIHLTGAADYERLKTEYASMPFESRIFAFLDSVEYAMSAADAVVSRGGATSIAELMYYRVPAVLIPYPHAYQHQAANAGVLRDKGAAVIIPDRELDSGALAAVLDYIILDPEKRCAMKDGYDTLPLPDSKRILSDLVLG